MSNSQTPQGGATTYKNSTKWVMLFFVCMLFFLINGFIYTSFNVLIRSIAEELGWSAGERALVVSGISSGMIWFVFVAGVMLDKFSPRKLLSIFAVFAGVAVILRGRITSAGPYFALMFVYGALVGFVLPSLGKLNSLWFDRKDFALANGFLTASSPLGQITGNMLAVPIMNALGGWRTLFLCQGILLIVFTIIFFIFTKERRHIDAALSSEKIKTEADLGVWKNIREIVKVPQFWIYTLANACFLGMIYAGGSQGQIVLQGDPNWALDKSISGIVPSFNNFASMCCYILMPLIVRKFFKKNYEKNYKLIAIISGVIAALCYSYGYQSYNLTVICVCMVIAGICYGSAVPAPKVMMVSLPEVSGPRSGTATGIYTTIERLAQTIMVGSIGGFIALYPESMGAVLSKFWLVMLVSPVLLSISFIFDKRQAKASAAASQA